MVSFFTKEDNLTLHELEQLLGIELKVDASHNEGMWSETVFDSNGERVPGALISTPGGVHHHNTVSDLDGNFQIQTDGSSNLNNRPIAYLDIASEAE